MEGKRGRLRKKRNRDADGESLRINTAEYKATDVCRAFADRQASFSKKQKRISCTKGSSSLFLSLPFFASVCVDFVPSSVFCSSLFHLLSSFCPIHHFPPSFVSIIFLTIFSLVLPSSSPSLLFLPVSSPLPLCHFPAPSPPPTLLFLSPPSPRLPSRSPSLCDSLFFFFYYTITT